MAGSGDWVRRFHLETAGVRGVVTRIGPAWREVLANANYPPSLAGLLGECLAATALFAGEIKMAGALSIQLRAEGPLRILFAECTPDGHLRGLARWDGEVESALSLASVGRDALLAITIERPESNQRYQGLVPLEGQTLADAFEAYFRRSEQLPTAIRLLATEELCAGMMLQQVPSGGAEALRDPAAEYERVTALFATLATDELVGLPVEALLPRLFAEDDIRLHAAQPLAFGCRCSRERVSRVLVSLGREEVEAAAAGGGSVEVRCEFCNRLYRFDAVDLAEVFATHSAVPASPTRQ
jgi:molecular chaperone Hsp33